MPDETTNQMPEPITQDPHVIREVMATDWEALVGAYWELESLAFDLGMGEAPIEEAARRLFALRDLLKAHLVDLSLQDLVTAIVVGDQDPERIGKLTSLHSFLISYANTSPER